MNEEVIVEVMELVSKTDRVKAKTADGVYSMTGERTTGANVVTGFNGGCLMKNGAQVAYVQSWHNGGGMTVQYTSGDVAEISAAVETLVKALTANPSEEGGEA